jgi:hypothetical protein
VGDDDPQVRTGDGDVFQQHRVGVFQRPGADEARPLVDVDRNAELFGPLEEANVARVLRIPVRIDRRALQAAEAEVIDVVRELLDAGRVVGIDRAPADEAALVLLHEPGDQLLVGANAAKGGDDAKNNDLVAAFGRREELLRPRVERIALLRRRACKVNIFRELHFGPLGLPGEFDKFVRKVVGVPHKVGVGVNEHAQCNSGGIQSTKHQISNNFKGNRSSNFPNRAGRVSLHFVMAASALFAIWCLGMGTSFRWSRDCIGRAQRIQSGTPFTRGHP